jgi:hypothetical protein
MIMENIFLILTAICLFLLALLFFSREDLESAFRGLNALHTTYAALVSLLLFLVYFSSGTHYHFQAVASAINEYLLKNYNYGPFFPYMNSLMMPLSGGYSGIAASSLLLGLSCMGIFLLSYKIFRKNRTALATALVYASVYVFILLHTPFVTCFSPVVHFFITYSILLSLISYDTNNKKAYATALVFIMLAGLSRFELMLMIYVFFIGLLFFRRKGLRRTLSERMLIPLMVFLLMLPAYLISMSYSIHRWGGILPNDAGRVFYQSFVWTSIDYFNFEYLPMSAYSLLQMLASPIIIIPILLSMASFFLMKKEQRLSIVLISLSSLFLLPPYLLKAMCLETKFLFYIILPVILALGYIISLRFPQKITGSRYVLPLFMAFMMILISFFLIRAVSVGYPVSDEELGAADTIIQSADTDPYIIVSEVTGQYKIDFLINRHTFLLYDLIKMTETYRTLVGESDLPDALKAHKYSQLACNAGLQNMLMAEQESIFNKTMDDIYKQYKSGRDPMKLGGAGVYLIQYPGCLEGNAKPCDAITQNLDAQLLYDRNGLRVYFIDLA